MLIISFIFNYHIIYTLINHLGMTKVVTIIEILKEYLSDESNQSKFKTSANSFIRKSPLGFDKVALLNISLLKGNLSSELFNHLSSNDLPVVSDSALSQARYKIDASFFQSWNECLLEQVYLTDTESFTTTAGLFRWKNYYIEAIDGSKLVLPQLSALGEHFGKHKSGTKHMKVETIMALLLCRYDVLNHYITQSEVSSIDIGEISVAKTWLQCLKSDAITLFDRGFASFAMFHGLLKYNKPFVMRLKVGFNKTVKTFVASSSQDSIVTFTANGAETIKYINEQEDSIKKGDSVTLRFVKVILPSGEIEVLATSFLDAIQMTIDDLATLYQMRWGIETCFDRLKNHLLIMCFSGQKPQAILQDIYATIFTHNLQQIFVNEAQEVVNQQHKELNKYHYAVNNVTAISILKPKLIKIFLSQNPKQIVEHLIKVMSKNTDAIRPKRKSRHRIKSIARRRNLVTQRNFKRVA